MNFRSILLTTVIFVGISSQYTSAQAQSQNFNVGDYVQVIVDGYDLPLNGVGVVNSINDDGNINVDFFSDQLNDTEIAPSDLQPYSTSLIPLQGQSAQISSTGRTDINGNPMQGSSVTVALVNGDQITVTYLDQDGNSQSLTVRPDELQLQPMQPSTDQPTTDQPTTDQPIPSQPPITPAAFNPNQTVQVTSGATDTDGNSLNGIVGVVAQDSNGLVTISYLDNSGTTQSVQLMESDLDSFDDIPTGQVVRITANAADLVGTSLSGIVGSVTQSGGGVVNVSYLDMSGSMQIATIREDQVQVYQEPQYGDVVRVTSRRIDANTGASLNGIIGSIAQVSSGKIMLSYLDSGSNLQMITTLREDETQNFYQLPQLGQAVQILSGRSNAMGIVGVVTQSMNNGVVTVSFVDNYHGVQTADFRADELSNAYVEYTPTLGERVKINSPRFAENGQTGTIQVIHGGAVSVRLTYNAVQVGINEITPFTPPPVAVYVPESYNDNAEFNQMSSLGRFGQWVTFGDGSQVFVPDTTSDWVPYQNGYWYMSSYGWTWQSYDGFGDITDHYGSWRHHNRYGWVWVPFTGEDYYWHAAVVTFYTGDNDGYIGWSPYYSGFQSEHRYGAENGFDDGYWEGYEDAIRHNHDRDHRGVTYVTYNTFISVNNHSEIHNIRDRVQVESTHDVIASHALGLGRGQIKPVILSGGVKSRPEDIRDVHAHNDAIIQHRGLDVHEVKMSTAVRNTHDGKQVTVVRPAEQPKLPQDIKIKPTRVEPSKVVTAPTTPVIVNHGGGQPGNHGGNNGGNNGGNGNGHNGPGNNHGGTPSPTPVKPTPTPQPNNNGNGHNGGNGNGHNGPGNGHGGTTPTPSPTPVKPAATPTPTPVKPSATPTPSPTNNGNGNGHNGGNGNGHNGPGNGHGGTTPTPSPTPVKPAATPTPTPVKPSATPTPSPTNNGNGNGHNGGNGNGHNGPGNGHGGTTPTPSPTPVKPAATPTPTPVKPSATPAPTPASTPAPTNGNGGGHSGNGGTHGGNSGTPTPSATPAKPAATPAPTPKPEPVKPAATPAPTPKPEPVKPAATPAPVKTNPAPGGLGLPKPTPHAGH